MGCSNIDTVDSCCNGSGARAREGTDVCGGRGERIAAGTAVRFEPGQQRTVELVDLAGARIVHGFRGLVQGSLF